MRSSSVAGFFAVVLLVTLSGIAYWVAMRGLADVVAQDPRYEIERWRSGKFTPDVVKLNVIQTELHKALNLDPGNPTLLEDMGWFYAKRTERDPSHGAEVRELRQQSLQLFKQSLALRPTSGHAFINVAYMKYRLGEIDLEFSQILQQALLRSPWEPQYQLIAIELGLANWHALSDSTRQSMRYAIRSQGQWKLVNQKTALSSLLKRYNRPDLSCLLEADSKPCGAF